MCEPVFTIGHSTRALAEFLGLLRGSRVQVVLDVRRLPGSTRYPWFDHDALCAALQQAGIGYRHARDLTGRRPVSRQVPFEVNSWWQNRSFHNYADHALSEEFGRGLAELRESGRESRVAVLCSEAVWWRCHRRIIADHLLADGQEVWHILGDDRVDAAQLSRGAVIGPGGAVTYPGVR